MGTPTKADALLVLVFVGVFSLSLILVAFALGVAGRFSGLTTDYLIESISAILIAAAGGGFAAFKYRGKQDG